MVSADTNANSVFPATHFFTDTRTQLDAQRTAELFICYYNPGIDHYLLGGNIDLGEQLTDLVNFSGRIIDNQRVGLQFIACPATLGQDFLVSRSLLLSGLTVRLR